KRMWENVSQIENSEDKVMRILLERRDHFAKAGKILLNSEMTAFVFVLMAEKLPILETVKGIQQLEALNIPVDGLIINKVLPDHAVGEFYESRKAQESSYIKEIEERFAGKDMWKINMAGSDLRGLDSIRDFAGSFV
ncbi:MAG: ArsA family ATPase, partial [Spirochaetota bacterium]|nr:ArsA family ATPase [Spirochaetota bacterium]